MSEVHEGDVVADVGAFIGLYSVALAKRVGPTGRVFAFEPDPENFAALQAHISLNAARSNVRLIQAAAAERDTRLNFSVGGSQSSLGHYAGGGQIQVESIRLDSAIREGPLDILKIDVEGYEEHVLKGATALLQNPTRRPRLIFIEVHPYVWPAVGTTSDSLLSLLQATRYRVERPNGQLVQGIDFYGEIVARTAAVPDGSHRAAAFK
jgi:FkbM family methyltransferase